MQNERVTEQAPAVPRHIDEQVIAAAAQYGEIIPKVSTNLGRGAVQDMKPAENFTNNQEVH